MNRLIVLFLVFVAGSVLAQSGRTVLKERSMVNPDRNPSAKLIAVDEVLASKLLVEEKGKVLVVNIWATWCGPCVREFPELVKLRNVYHEKGLEVVFVSVDDIKVSDSRVEPFLEKQKVTFPSYIKSARDDRRFFDDFGKGFRNVIPTTYIYDREGNLAFTAIGAQTFGRFEEMVKPLLFARQRGVETE